MLYKERSLPGLSFGDTKNGRYSYDYVAGGNPKTFCTTMKVCTKEKVQETYDLARTHCLFEIPDVLVLGSEKFGSTKRPRPAINNCEHWRNHHVAYPIGGVAIDYARPTRLANRWGYFRYGGYRALIDPVHEHPLIDITAAQRKAWHEMQPEFAGKVSLINFIYELKDFKDIVKHMALPRQSLETAIRKIRALGRRVRKKDFKFDPSRPAAEIHLANEFALKPLISDVVEIHLQIKQMVSALQSEFANDGLSDNTRYSSTEFVHGENFTKWTGMLIGSQFKTKFTAGLVYTYEYKLRGFLDAVASYWGLKFTAEAMWNGMPFSFLVDYVFSVGSSIARMEHDPNVALKVGTYWESLLTTRDYGLVIDPDHSASPIIVNDHFVSSKTLTTGSQASYYTRVVKDPNKGTSLPSLKMPNSRQALNVAALLRCFV